MILDREVKKYLTDVSHPLRVSDWSVLCLGCLTSSSNPAQFAPQFFRLTLALREATPSKEWRAFQLDLHSLTAPPPSYIPDSSRITSLHFITTRGSLWAANHEEIYRGSSVAHFSRCFFILAPLSVSLSASLAVLVGSCHDSHPGGTKND